MNKNTNSIATTDYLKMMIKDIVVNNFKAAEVMEKYGIDFCCNGKRELKIALDEKKIDESKFLKDLEQAILKPSASEERYENWELYFLTQYIVNKHHSYVKEAIPRITAHVDKVADRHGEKYPFLIEVRDLFHSVANEITSHMMKEERILFPLIKYITDCRRFNEKPKNEGYNSVKGPINQMEYEHDSAGSAMQSIRELTNNYKLPDDACTTFTVTYQELDEFEKDLHKHVHLENNILFPGIIRIEEELMKGKY